MQLASEPVGLARDAMETAHSLMSSSSAAVDLLDKLAAVADLTVNCEYLHTGMPWAIVQCRHGKASLCVHSRDYKTSTYPLECADFVSLAVAVRSAANQLREERNYRGDIGYPIVGDAS